jgi:hypothetical protein
MPSGAPSIIALALLASESAESTAAAAAKVKQRLRMVSSLGAWEFVAASFRAPSWVCSVLCGPIGTIVFVLV